MALASNELAWKTYSVSILALLMSGHESHILLAIALEDMWRY